MSKDARISFMFMIGIQGGRIFIPFSLRRPIMLNYIPLVYSIIAGAMSIALFYLSLTNRELRKPLYIFSLVFLIASWSGIEWALWIAGYNLFELVLFPVVPLDFFFLSWIAFVIWYGEYIKERKIWIYFIISLVAIYIIATFCMDCLRFWRPL